MINEVRSRMKISVELPDTASFVHLDQAYLREILVMTLYHLFGKLSEQEACVTLGVSRRIFEEMLPRLGFAVLADDQNTIAIELVMSEVRMYRQCNTGPLISLEKLSQGYVFIRRLYDPNCSALSSALAEVAEEQFADAARLTCITTALLT